MSLRYRSLFLALTLLINTAECVTQARLKFEKWFPYYSEEFQSILQNCTQELEAYRVNNRTFCYSNCACVADCVLEEVKETTKSNMASASIVLGLMPSVLALLAPSIAEMALLSARAPFLAGILCFGCPAARYGGMPDIKAVLAAKDSKVLAAFQTFVQNSSASARTVLRIFLYGLTLASVANTVEMSIRVDLRTISGWRCGQLFMPLIWSEMTFVTFALGMIAMRTRISRPASDTHGKDDRQRLIADAARTRSTFSNFRFDMDNFHRLASAEDTATTEFVWFLSLFAAVAQTSFGVLVLSSLVFISIVDSIPLFVRYAASCIVARLIVTFELTSARLERTEEQGSYGMLEQSGLELQDVNATRKSVVSTK
ncbi:hypothetical protein CKM354_000663000 [Cercospora kikuchii]|uniref:Uncharacterized protein n=1 Tax=Cercospora kikuchii TaxID=84275 RepID=A0A9P3CL63_9PEZI|nr:uncharacterized protein CKM354_000663000 [Cercospora kikuchii]GIZ43402.1 hypothetical protein CKM354_000663000 [Cercospora kikuchii]